MKEIFHRIFPALGMLLLILDSGTAITGASQGITLCISSVIPSIFPFLVLSGMVVAAFSGIRMGGLGKFLGIPQGCEGLLIAGFLGGYPTGAREVARAYEKGSLTKEEAQRMLAFCNNAGPSFLFGILGKAFPKIWMLWLLWGVHILSALCVGLILPQSPARSGCSAKIPAPSLAESLKQAVITMGNICGWVILFRVILAFGDKWLLWAAPKSLRIAICGFLELANGCCSLSQIDSVSLRFILCSAMLSFGGICVTMQTASVSKGLRLRMYFPGKLLQTCISVLLSLLCSCVWIAECPINPIISIQFFVLFCILIVFFLKSKIRTSNPSILRV